MVAARSLAGKILKLEGNTSMQMGVAAGFFSAAAVASAASDDGAACPAYPWPQDGAQGGRKVFMLSDCAACHSMLPYAGLREAAPAGEVEAKVTEIIVVNEEQPATARPLQSSYTPVVTKMLEGLRHSNLYTAEELKKKMALPTPVWLHRCSFFSHPMHEERTPQAA